MGGYTDATSTFSVSRIEAEGESRKKMKEVGCVHLLGNTLGCLEPKVPEISGIRDLFPTRQP